MKMTLYRHLAFLVVVFSSLLVHAQNNMDSMVERLGNFGTKLPQEQVFIHLDNTSYYLGDTIFYKAYVKRGDDGKPSNISGILYCELLNNDGYLVERQMLPLEKGEAHGTFSLSDTLLYAGYYELRAYTRWQLNWGVTEQPHSKWSEKYFFNNDMAKDYYRDYEKLYSRVFPVYNKPTTPGNYSSDMTLRPLATYYKNPADNPETIVQLFPEGGGLVAGVSQRVAWEVRNETGMALEGRLAIAMPNGDTIISETVNRGRGVFDILPVEGEKLKVLFVPTGKNNPANVRTAKTSLPEPVRDGVVLCVNTDKSGIDISYVAAGVATQETLGMTVMHNGVLKHALLLDRPSMHLSVETAGVYQITIFNPEGRVYADRLCFYLPKDFHVENVAIKGVKEKHYAAYEPVSLDLHGMPGASLSVSVRDAAKSEYVYDTGSMLTETLLASQIRGFVPHPQWFFQEDTPERRQALDLLMMVQGWRKYSWRQMAVRGEFEIAHMPEERFPYWNGQINNYTYEQTDNVAQRRLAEFVQASEKWADDRTAESSANEESETEAQGNSENQSSRSENSETVSSSDQLAENPNANDDARGRFTKNEKNLKRPVVLHVEFTQPGTEGVLGNSVSQGTFSFKFPRYYNEFFFFAGASDSTKWKKGEPPVWVQSGRTKRDDTDFPEFYLKLDPFYPRFPIPYDYYQTHVAPMPQDYPLYNYADEQVRMMQEVTVGARRSGRRKFGLWKPAFVVDAYEAFNATCDAGFVPGYFMGYSRFSQDVARTYIGDMKTERRYEVQTRFNGRIDTIDNISDHELQYYNCLWNLSDVVVYTDYSLRNDRHNKYSGNELPTVTVDLRLLEDGGKRSYLKNRRWRMKGFAIPDEFYSPDYSKIALPEQDYRRTLYWNPQVILDNSGKANIKLYNNSSPSILQVVVEGWGQDGTPQSGRVN
jgi:hypothetical protein